MKLKHFRHLIGWNTDPLGDTSAGGGGTSPPETTPNTGNSDPGGRTGQPVSVSSPPSKPDSIESLVDAAAAKLPPELQPSDSTGNRSPKTGNPAAPPDPLAVQDPLADPAGAPLPPDQVFKTLGLEAAGLPPETHGPVAEFLSDWYQNTYTPVALQLRDRAEQQAAWHQELQGFIAGPAYRYGEALARDPQLYEDFQNFLQGGGAAPQNPPPELAGINPDDLDDTSRALYENVRHTHSANAELRAALEQTRQQAAQLEQQIQEINGWRGQREQLDFQNELTQRGAAKKEEFEGAIQRFNQGFGFDIRGYQKEFKQAVDFAIRELRGLKADWEAAGNSGPFQPPAAHALLKEGLRRAGYSQIAARRKQQAATSIPPPQSRRPGGAAGQDRVADAVNEYAATLGIS